jgi:hypothetical protein
MQNVSCPGCGAPVAFISHASVQAVCEFCQTTVLKNADAVKDLGKMGEVLEDYSPIQIGTAGKHQGKSFTVVGRIQLRYAAGMWNEWYLLFDDASTAWLGDSSGLYTITTEKPELASSNLPKFEQITPAHSYTIDGRDYLAAEVREAQCIAGQGELPFQFGSGWRVQVADFRRGNQFLTLDYSGGDTPRCYIGLAITLEQLACQLLRDDDAVKTSAGKYKGKVDALDCPACGSSIKYLPGVTSHLICPACQAQVDAASPKAQVLAAGERLAQVASTLKLGAKAKLNGAEHQIIGILQRKDDENTVWTEYLLYNTRGGFIWLVETTEAWYRAKVQADWPNWHEGSNDANMSGRSFKKQVDYLSEVVFAAGAFNWRVAVGDQTRIVEFGLHADTLSAEISGQEITWSYANLVEADQIRAWFGKDIAADKQAKGVSVKKLIIWLLILNSVPLLFGSIGSWITVAVAILAIWLPHYMMSK